MEKLFHLKENNTTARTEIVAGLTTFMTMAYIIALNPNLLTGFGAEGGTQLWNGVFLATCIASAVGTLVMAFAANKPFAMAPGMGLNSFFAVVVANIVSLTGMSYLQSFQTALCVILIEGIVFIILSVLKVREKIVEAIPLGIRLGIAPAIGLMLLNIGIGSNAGVYSSDGGPFYVMRDFFGALTPSLAKANMGDGYPQMVLTVVTMFVGLFLIVLFAHKKIKGSVLLGMLCASGIYWAGEAIFLHTNPFASLKGASFVPAFGDMAETTLFKFDFAALGEIGWFTVVTLVITFCIIDMFDTIGTLVGTASRAGMVDKDGNMPRMREALLADAIGTVTGACTGTSTVTTFVESASGVEAGGRTGLTALTTGVLFLASMFLAPIAAIIPAAATSSALIYVGLLMLGGLKKIDFDDVYQSLPVAIMLISMPVIIEAPYIVSLWLGQLPEYVVPFTRLIIAISAIDAMASPLMTAAHATGHIRLYQSSVGTMVMLNIPVSYVFLRLGFPPLTVFYVSLAISVVCLFMRLWIVRRLMPFPVKEYVVRVFGTSLAVCTLATIAPVAVHIAVDGNIHTVLSVCALSLLSCAVSIYYVGLDRHERKFVAGIVRKKILHKQ